jgi:hypothetical protein
MGFKIDLRESNDYSNKDVDLSVDYIGDNVIFTLEGDARVDFEEYFKSI